LGDPKRFASGKQVGAFAGLVPRQFQSGESDRKGRITRRGPGVLRKLLVECAWAALRYNAWARATYARLTRGGVTRKKPAIVALARRLLVRLWAMLRDGKPWRTDPVPAAPCPADRPQRRPDAPEGPAAPARSWVCPRVTGHRHRRAAERMGGAAHRMSGTARRNQEGVIPDSRVRPRRRTAAKTKTTPRRKSTARCLTPPRLHSRLSSAAGVAY